MATETLASTQLEPGRVYTWEELAAYFGFSPSYLSIAGGMPVSAARGAVLLITHPGGAKSFDYDDYWDGADLIYTGRGKTGPQSRTGQNLDVAENRRDLFAFEAAGPKRLQYLGQPRCVEERVGRAPGDDGIERDVLLFRLRFSEGEGRRHTADSDQADARRTTDLPQRRPRPFEPGAPTAPAVPQQHARPEETQAQIEKAVRGHARILETLADALAANGWHAIEEIPAAVDLWATDPEAGRVIFEAKTVSGSTELDRCRGGLAQLLEYRVEYGHVGDEICLAVNEPVSVRRARLLDQLGVAVLVVNEDGCRAGNDAGTELASRLNRSTEQ